MSYDLVSACFLRLRVKTHAMPFSAKAGIYAGRYREPMLPAEALVAAGAGRLDAADLTRGLAAGGLSATAETVEGLIAEAADHAERVALEETERDVLAEVDRPTYELPLLDGGVDLGGLYRMASALSSQGVR